MDVFGRLEIETVRTHRTCGIVGEAQRDWYRRAPLTEEQRTAWDHVFSSAIDGYLDLPDQRRLRLDDRYEAGGTRIRSIIIPDSSGRSEYSCWAFSVIEQADGSTFTEYHLAVEAIQPDGSIEVVWEPSEADTDNIHTTDLPEDDLFNHVLTQAWAIA